MFVYESNRLTDLIRATLRHNRAQLTLCLYALTNVIVSVYCERCATQVDEMCVDGILDLSYICIEFLSCQKKQRDWIQPQIRCFQIVLNISLNETKSINLNFFFKFIFSSILIPSMLETDVSNYEKNYTFCNIDVIKSPTNKI